jgi:DNA-binding GntR family transcriptional regulator
MPVRNTESETSRNRIYRDLRRSIIMGHLPPGARLTVQEIAKRHESSTTPVRDALQMLGQDGLVTIKPRSGYFVTRVTLKKLRDMLELRAILELSAVEHAATRITDEEIEALKHEHAGYTGDDDVSYDRYTDENRTFHYMVALASGNSELADVLGHIHDRLARFMVMRRAGEIQESSHARIIEALEVRNVKAARQAMLDELNETREAVLDRVMQEDGGLWEITS